MCSYVSYVYKSFGILLACCHSAELVENERITQVPRRNRPATSGTDHGFWAKSAAILLSPGYKNDGFETLCGAKLCQRVLANFFSILHKTP